MPVRDPIPVRTWLGSARPSAVASSMPATVVISIVTASRYQGSGWAGRWVRIPIRIAAADARPSVVNEGTIAWRFATRVAANATPSPTMRNPSQARGRHDAERDRGPANPGSVCALGPWVPIPPSLPSWASRRYGQYGAGPRDLRRVWRAVRAESASRSWGP